MPERRTYGISRLIIVGGMVAALLCSCSGAGGNGGGGSEETQPTSEQNRELRFSEVFSGASGSGSGEARAIVASNPQEITSEPEVAGLVIERTEPTDPVYVAVFVGQRNTGGYSVAVNRMERNGDSVRVVVEETEPPDDSIVSQALTYPCVVASTTGLEPSEIADLTFEFVTPDGENLDIPVTGADG